MEAKMVFSPLPGDDGHESSFSSDPSNVQLIDQESNIGVKRPADSQLMAIGKRNKVKDMDLPDENTISPGLDKFKESAMETKVNEHLPKHVEDEASSESDEDETIAAGYASDFDGSSDDSCSDSRIEKEGSPDTIRRPSDGKSYYLIWAYADKFHGDEPESKHKEFLDSVFGSGSDASKSYNRGCRFGRMDIFYLRLSKEECVTLKGKKEILWVVKTSCRVKHCAF